MSQNSDLSRLLLRQKKIRVAGFDDAAWNRRKNPQASLCGIICANTRFEGMLWGSLTIDGLDATERIATLLMESKFRPQVHMVLLDGITFGGMNVVDLPELHRLTGMPCVAVMRRQPDLQRFADVVKMVGDPDGERTRRRIAAGTIHEIGGFFFQVQGAEPEDVATALGMLTDQGKVPEALRLAHLIGSAVVTGQSGKRA